MAGTSGRSKEKKKHNKGKLRRHSRFARRLRAWLKRQAKRSGRSK